jgi:hypothetical protein
MLVVARGFRRSRAWPVGCETGRMRYALLLSLALSACGSDDAPAADGGPTTPRDRDAGGVRDDDAGSSTGRDAAPPPPLEELPDWVNTLAIGEWYAIPGTALSSVEPTPVPAGNTGPRSKVVAWTSFVVDPRDSTLYSPANGGHADYSGNEVDALALETDPPRWVQRIEPSPDDVLVDGEYYTDGRPTSRHTYYGLTMDVARDRIMLFSGARWQNGFALGTSDSFDLLGDAWNPAGTHPDVPAEVSSLPGSPFVEVPSTGDVYVFPSWTVARWNASSNDWTMVLEDTSLSAQSALSALDTQRNRILLVGGESTVSHTYSLGGAAIAEIDLRGSEAGRLRDTGACAMIYVEAIDRYLVRLEDGGGAITAIDAESFEATEWPTIGGDAIPETTNGVWRRFLYVPRLHGAVYVPAYETDVWFLRLH